MSKLAVLGTGLLGSGMVENLLAKGHAVRIWNRSREQARPARRRRVRSPRRRSRPTAVRGAARVHLVLAEDSAVDAVIGALRPGLGPGCAGARPQHQPARSASQGSAPRRCAQAGVRYVPAPVFMSPQNAREASGLMLLGGTAGRSRAAASLAGRR
jgi:3-hydroxyisobutyrate dehydrogenase